MFIQGDPSSPLCKGKMHEVVASPLQIHLPLSFQSVCRRRRAPTITIMNTKMKGGENMQLLTKELREKIPALYSQENEKDPMVYIKFFDPVGSWTWYVTEGEQRGRDF